MYINSDYAHGKGFLLLNYFFNISAVTFPEVLRPLTVSSTNSRMPLTNGTSTVTSRLVNHSSHLENTLPMIRERPKLPSSADSRHKRPSSTLWITLPNLFKRLTNMVLTLSTPPSMPSTTTA